MRGIDDNAFALDDNAFALDDNAFALDDNAFALSVKDLSVSIGSRKLVHIDEMVLQPGSITALVGANGSGKTSFLRALAGQFPSRGEVRLRSYFRGSQPLPPNMSPGVRASHLSYLPQELFENAALSVDYALELPLLFAASETRSTTAQTDAIQRFHLKPLLARSLHELSGGERQRVSLAQKWLLGAPVLLWDEPFNHLDAEHKVALMETLRTYVANGSAALISVHGSARVRSFATHFVELSRGHITAMGSIEQLRPDAEESLWLSKKL